MAPAARLKTATLQLSTQTWRTTPSKYSKACRWQDRKCSSVSASVNSRYSLRLPERASARISSREFFIFKLRPIPTRGSAGGFPFVRIEISSGNQLKVRIGMPFWPSSRFTTESVLYPTETELGASPSAMALRYERHSGSTSIWGYAHHACYIIGECGPRRLSACWSVPEAGALPDPTGGRTAIRANRTCAD